MKLPGAKGEASFINWIFNIQTGTAEAVNYEAFIIRKGIHPNGITADRTFYFNITEGLRSKKLARAEAVLYEGNTKKQSWDVHNARKSYAKLKKGGADIFITPGFILVDTLKNKGFLQFGAINTNGDTDLITITPELQINNVRKNVFVVSASDDHPDFQYETIIPRIGTSGVFPRITGRSYKPFILSSFVALAAHPDIEMLYIPIDSKGDYMDLGNNIIGIVPIMVNKMIVYDEYLLVRNWLVAHKQNGQLLWGWASPQFGYITPPIWKDWNLYEDYERTKDFREFFLKEGSSASIKVVMVEGSLLVAQLLNSNWQMYVQPNLIDLDGTFNEPNTYAGKIPGGKTYDEAVKNGESWLLSNTQKTNYQYSGLYKRVMARITEITKDRLAQGEKFTEEFNKRVEYLRKNPPPQPKVVTSASYKSLEPSFTNKLRTMSATASSNMATKSLNTVTNQLRQAAGKGYKAP